MRLFIAIEFEDEIKTYLEEIGGSVRVNSSKGNFTRKDNFHLTLHFLGETEISKIQGLRDAIDRIAINYNPFQLSFEKLGQFIKNNRSIVWVGLKKSQKLFDLQKELGFILRKEGFEIEDRSYSPHITIARETVFQNSNESLNSLAEVEPRAIYANAISLMESTREDGQLVYRSLYSKELRIE